MKGRTYDKVLITLALLAPLAMVALSKWRASLDIWYAPFDTELAIGFGESFERNVTRWVQDEHGIDTGLILVADRDCPCTKATLATLEDAHSRAERKGVGISVRYINDSGAGSGSVWKAVLSEIPATPTLLVINQGRLIYAGPVTSGNFCTTAVRQVLGIVALQASNSGPIFNWVEKGCYCRLPSIQS